jgi:hypothetical protein
MNYNEKLKSGFESGFDRLVFRPSGEYEELNAQAVADCGGASFVDAWYVCVQWQNGSRTPYPMLVLDPRDDDEIDEEEAETILKIQESLVLDEAHKLIESLGVVASCYIKEPTKLLYAPARQLFGLPPL